MYRLNPNPLQVIDIDDLRLRGHMGSCYGRLPRSVNFNNYHISQLVSSDVFPSASLYAGWGVLFDTLIPCPCSSLMPNKQVSRPESIVTCISPPFAFFLLFASPELPFLQITNLYILNISGFTQYSVHVWPFPSIS